MFLFFSVFFSPRDIRVHSADRRETLRRDRKWVYVQFCNLSPKIWGERSPEEIWGPKTCKIRGDFGQLQTLIANISGTDVTSKIRKASDQLQPFHVRRAE